MSDRELIKQKKEALIEMTNGFADRYLDEDYNCAGSSSTK